MKKYFLFSILLLLSACDTAPSDLSKAKQDFVCKDHGGVYEYVPWTLQARCMDGTNVDRWRSAIITEDFFPERRQDG